jgi:hypothetical protein
LINNRWTVELIQWDEIASLRIHHIKLGITRIVELARVFTYDEEALSGIFDWKLSDRDLEILNNEINRYLK